MRNLIIVPDREEFENRSVQFGDTVTSIASEDICEEISEGTDNTEWAVEFFAALYRLVSKALLAREDILLDASRITKKTEEKLIRALNNTSGLKMHSVETGDGTGKYYSD